MFISIKLYLSVYPCHYSTVNAKEKTKKTRSRVYSILDWEPRKMKTGPTFHESIDFSLLHEFLSDKPFPKHIITGRIRCIDCCEESFSAQQMAFHYIQHFPDQKLLKCKFCDDQYFNSVYNVSAHLKKYHNIYGSRPIKSFALETDTACASQTDKNLNIELDLDVMILRSRKTYHRKSASALKKSKQNEELDSIQIVKLVDEDREKITEPVQQVYDDTFIFQMTQDIPHEIDQPKMFCCCHRHCCKYALTVCICNCQLRYHSTHFIRYPFYLKK